MVIAAAGEQHAVQVLLQELHDRGPRWRRGKVAKREPCLLPLGGRTIDDKRFNSLAGIEDKARFDTPELTNLGVWTVLASLGGALAVFLNGLHVVRIQVVCAVSYAILSMAWKWLAAPYWGPSGIMGAGSVAFVITTLLPYCFLIPRLLRRLSVRSNLDAKGA